MQIMLLNKWKLHFNHLELRSDRHIHFFEFKNLQRYMYESRSLVSTLQPFADKNAEALLIYVLFLFQIRVPYYKNWSQKQSIFIYIIMPIDIFFCVYGGSNIRKYIFIEQYMDIFFYLRQLILFTPAYPFLKQLIFF